VDREDAGALLVLMSSELPNQTASAAQQVKTAHALARSGIRVRLIAKHVGAVPSPEEVLGHYGLVPDDNLEVIIISVPKGRQRNRVFFARVLASKAWRGKRIGILTREPRVFPMSMITPGRTPILFEAHEPAGLDDRPLNRRSRRLQGWALRSARGVVAVTKAGGEGFAGMGVEPQRLAVIPNGADPLQLDAPRPELTSEIRLSYVGSFQEDRGVDVLVKALPLIDKRVSVHTVGEWRPDRRELIADLARALGVEDRLTMHPAVAHGEVPKHLAEADILVLPMTGSSVGQTFASPMKLFEYMAAGRPIIASDLPTVREIVGEDEAWFFKMGDERSLADAVTRVVAEWPDARMRASRAEHLLETSYTFDARARRLTSFMQRLGMLVEDPRRTDAPAEGWEVGA
jgi:glycosyltransferase involved in cell wall biosynthesis